jgi:acyl transferase domain-containing protein/acyl carrier protein/SAM-dependent methyltransferase
MFDRSHSPSSGSALDEVTAHLKQALASVTNVPAHEIDAQAPIESLGLRATLHLTNELEKSLGWLPKTLYFECATLTALAQYLVDSYPEQLSSLLGRHVGTEVVGKPIAASEPVTGDSTHAGSRASGALREHDKGENIAIVGLSCRFAHARTMHEFWDNLRTGRDCIQEIPRERWDHRRYFDAEPNTQGKTYGKWGSFIDGFDQFDPAFFNITPREAEMMDPQERVFLECVYAAVEDAGYTPGALSRSGVTGTGQPVGVYVGLMFEEYNLFRGDILGSPASIANRISYYCNFRGPSMAVDTMCSASLTALHLACCSLKRDECHAAIAGGVNLTLHPNKYLMLARMKMASPKGRCRSFGEDAGGYVPGEGAAAVVLKTLANALADGDHIYGVIQATAINQAGKTRSYFAPSPHAQAEVVGQALKTAGISPRLITYIEAHGTGTSLGDPIEIAGLTKAFRTGTDARQFCAVGSVKSNIGHCESAAGIAGLTKVLLQLKHAQLVPSLHSERLNPNINFADTPFVVQQTLAAWPRPQVDVDGAVQEYPRIAGISSFGGGGSNAHIVVEEYCDDARAGERRAGRVAIALSARTPGQLREQARQLLDAIAARQVEADDLWDMAYTLQVGREAMEHRLGMTAGTMAELSEKLTRYVEGIEGIEELYHGDVKPHREMAAAFRGDEDLAKALDSWLTKGKLPNLLQLWTKGVEIDWRRLYAEGATPRRVSLPTYPFARERYWVEPFDGDAEDGTERSERTARAGDVLHPLVHTNRSRVGEQRYESRFCGDEFFLAGHMVKGERMLPAVAYLEMVRAAIEQAWPARPESTVLELRHTVWAQPIVVSGPTRVSIVLSTTDHEQIAYEISSGDGAQAIVHCHGLAVWSREAAPARLDLARLDAQISQGGADVDPNRLYEALTRMGLVHGSAFHALTALHRGNQQVLARLRLPSVVEDTGDDYVLHPSLLDGALQTSAGLIDTVSDPSKQTRLPFALDSLRIVATCAPGEMVVWTRYAPGNHAADPIVKFDIDLCDEHGNVCVEMRGFSTRAVPGEDAIPVRAGQRLQPGLHACVPVWTAVRRDGHPTAAPPESTRVLLLGGDDHAGLDWVRQAYHNAVLVSLASSATVDVIAATLNDCAFDHLVWMAPDIDGHQDRQRTADDEPQVIEEQERGVLAVFRMVKALLQLGYGDRDLRWTVITGQTHRVRRDDPIQPAHAGIAGLIGSLAKEYPHWRVTLLDIESLEQVTAQECLSMPPDPRGHVLARRDGEWFAQALADVPVLPQAPESRYRHKGVYVVIGGAGGLGEVWTRFMIERYQAHVVWIGRQPYNAIIEAKIHALARLGPAPLYFSADATDLHALQHAADAIAITYPRIHGVVHAAIVLHDQSLAGMDETRFRASLAAKVDVSVNVDRVFGGQDLDFVLFFSSLMSFLTSAGQSNYAAGCAFTDSFAHALTTRRPYPIRIMNWGYWGSVGIVADPHHSDTLARMGIGSIEPHEGMAALQTFVDSALSQMAVIKIADAAAIADLTFSERLTFYPADPESVVTGNAHEPGTLIENVSTTLPATLADGRQTRAIGEIDACAAELLAASLVSLGLVRHEREPEPGHDIRRLADLSTATAPAPFYERWLTSSVHYLRQQGLLDDEGTVSATVRSLADVWREWDANRAAWTRDPDQQARIALLETCLRALPDVLRGTQLATDVLFPDASLRLVEGIYRGNAVADYFNDVLGHTLSAWVDQRHPRGAREVRILEIGAGTGGTTAALLPLLQRMPLAEYCYTDLSRAFLIHAEEHYQPRLPVLTTALFDVSTPLASQSIAAAHYDVVIAANVLHATPDIRRTLRNAKAALKNQGILLLNEISTWSLFTHLTFGLLEGWWLHEDTAPRIPGSPGLAPEQWRKLLAEEGFDAIAFPAADAHAIGQQIIVARSDGWVRQPLDQPLDQLFDHASPAVSRHQAPSAPILVTPAVARPAPVGDASSLREKSVSYFQKMVASTLKMRPDQIEPRRPFAEYGLDSILVGQLTYRLRQVFTDVPATLFFEVQSIDELVDYFLTHKSQELASTLSPEATGASQPTSIVSERPRLAPQPVSLVSERQLAADAVGVRDETPQEKQNDGASRPHPLAFEPEPEPVPVPSAAAPGAAIFDVAIVGLSGRYPQANTLKQFWTNLSNGVNCITEIPKDRWNWETYYDSERGKPGRIYSKWGGFLDGIDQFDPLFFKISPKEAKRMDPQERLFVESCYHAIEDAGYTPESLGAPEHIGVFVGVMNARYTPQPAHASIANRVSYLFNFQGPSLAVDTACSSSLTAIHVALESLYSGQSACAIAGGVNLVIDHIHYALLADMTMLSSGSQCRAFGAEADGLVDAEGVGAIVLKPLRQAERDGDHIYGVIKGSAINAGGRTHGYTVPNPQAQARLVALALERAQVSADDVSYVEAHGTGTALGDPIEIAGLTRAFQQTSGRTQFCAIGSLKSNIGHCESAAGIAGLTKVLLQLQHEQLVPSLHAEIPNPEIDFSQTPFTVQRTLAPWRRPLRDLNGAVREIPRVAGISSFGAGGANAHVIVQEYRSPVERVKTQAAHAAPNVIVVLSARTAEQLKQKARDLSAFIRDAEQAARSAETETAIDLMSMAYTLQVGREPMDERLGFVVSSVAALAAKLRAFEAGEPDIDDARQGQITRDRGSVSVFGADPDLQRTIETWIAKGKLTKVLELWVKGLEVDWRKLYADAAPRRVSLPTYPFARERYWRDPPAGEPLAAAAQAAVLHLHPLLHRNTSDLNSQRYQSTFTGDEFFLRDHQVDGQRTLSPAACLEMARMAAADAVHASPDTVVELRDVVWGRPIVIAGTRQISIALLVKGHGQIDYEIYSEDGEGEEGESEVVHCQGRLVPTQDPLPDRLNLAQLERRMREDPLEPGGLYAACARSGLIYEPALQAVTAIHRGNDELLAHLRLPRTVEETAREYVLHPSLIDGALQAATRLHDSASNGAPDGASQARWLAAIDSLRVVAPCTGEMVAWIRYSPGCQAGDHLITLDLDLCDARGNVSAQMRGITWQPAALEMHEPSADTAAVAAVAATETAATATATATRAAVAAIAATVAAPAPAPIADHPLAASAPREIVWVPDQPASPAPVARRKPTDIALVDPSTLAVAAASASAEYAVRQQSTRRMPITLLSPAAASMLMLGQASSSAREASAITVFDEGGGIFSIQIASPAAGETMQRVSLHLRQALEKVREEASLKVLLIRGLDRGFSGGGVAVHNDAIEHRLYQALVSFPFPVIAILPGDAIGAGFLAAGLCDVMVCSDAAIYGFTDTQRHLYPTAAEARLFSARVGEVLARDLLYVSTAVTGRQLRAKGWTCPILPAADIEAYARSLAATLATKSPDALRLLKQHLARHLVGLVDALTPVEVASPASPASHVAPGSPVSPVAPAVESLSGDVATGVTFSATHLHLDTRADHVLIITVRMTDEPVDVRDLIAEVGQVLASLHEHPRYKAIVLTSERPDFLPDTTNSSLEDLVAACGRLLGASPIPIIAALTQNARDTAWLVSQLCDACVYSEAGAYSFATSAHSPSLVHAAATLFTHRFGGAAATEILLTGGAYSGADLQRRVGALLVATGDSVLATAVSVAERLATWPRARLTAWKRHVATALAETSASAASAGRMPAALALEPLHDTRAALPASPTAISLRSTVVTATAHPDGVVVVKMEDRDAKNMFSESLIEGLSEAFAHIEDTPDYKVVILTGYDHYFASGGTKARLLAIHAGDARFTDSTICQAALDCRLPVIAAMQGHGIGGGWTLGLFADIVVLSDESRYVSPYMNYGFTPGAGATYILPEKLGHDLARESLLTGQPFAGSALKQRGLLLRVLPRIEVYPAAMALARQIAEASCSRLIGLKAQLTASVHRPLQETYERELAMHAQTFVGQSDTLAGIHNNFADEIDTPAPLASALRAPVQATTPTLASEPARETARETAREVPALAARLTTLLASELQMRESDINADVQFVDLGLDSITAVTWVRKINETFHLSLEATTVYSYPTLSQLSRHVHAEAVAHHALAAQVVPLAADIQTTSEPRVSPSPSLATTRAARRLTSWRRRTASRFSIEPAAPAAPPSQPIAVIGMAGQFPQARNLDEFWQNIAQGTNCISRVTADRWDVTRYYRPGEVVAGKSMSQWLGALEDYDRFDPLFFNISPTEAESMDPQQRLFLQACWHTIENAGYDARSLSGSKCGVFVGCAAGDYHLLTREQQLSAQSFTGDATSILAARISYCLNLQGPCISIDTACSSSLVALAQACDSVASGASDLALAGGVYVMVGPELHIKTSQAGMLSPEGRCFSFDQRADGFVPGEGVGVVLLKRLADAERDRDIIAGVIHGWGVNQDGKTNGITAPNPESQTRLEQDVYDRYQIDPASIQLIEAHGTGTRLGDPIEVEGLKKAFAKYTQQKAYCALGSVKSNIGHCATAAGIAGFIKLMLAVQHQQLPPTINFERLNEHIDLSGSPFYINSRLQEWPRHGAAGRQAAISSFGFSGTNAHVVIGEYVPSAGVRPPASIGTRNTHSIIPLSARTPEQLDQRVRDLYNQLRDEASSLDLTEMAYTLQVGREPMEERVGFLVSSREQLVERLAAYLDRQSGIEDCYRGQVKRGKESLSLLIQDDDVKEILVSRWIAAGKLSKLLDLWTRGLELDWNQLYGEARPQRIRLPEYPFAKERYWIDVATTHAARAGADVPAGLATSVLHPLLHRNTSDLNQHRYTSTFTGDEPFLADHRVRINGGDAQPVLPGVAYLEMARAAIELASPRREDSEILELRHTIWLTPVFVTAPRHVSLALLSHDDGQLDFDIFSVDHTDRETIHCQGQAMVCRQSPPASIDIAQLTREMTQGRLDSATIYAMFADMGLDYGPAHRGITAIDLGERQLLAHVRVPPGAETSPGAYVLHPSVMDGALQASMGLLVDPRDLPSRPYVPFALKCLRIISPSTREMVAWVRFAGGGQPGDTRDKTATLDIDLCDRHGNVCVQIQGFSARVLETDAAPTRQPSRDASTSDDAEPEDERVPFDHALYRQLIADVVNGDLSVDEAVELG